MTDNDKERSIGPVVSRWRRSVTGGITGAFAFPEPAVTAVPALPQTSIGTTTVAQQAVLHAFLGTADEAPPYPPPTSNAHAGTGDEPDAAAPARSPRSPTT